MRTIELTKAKVAIVDDEDYEMIVSSGYRWTAFENRSRCYAGTAFRTPDGMRAVLMHRFIMGVTEREIEVDHINGNPLDNRRSNLRLATRGQNAKNRRKKVTAKLKYKGIEIDRGNGQSPYRARIYVDGKAIRLGSYKTQEEAARAYDNGARKYHGEFARLNFA
jgi:hypothetical protein